MQVIKVFLIKKRLLPFSTFVAALHYVQCADSVISWQESAILNVMAAEGAIPPGNAQAKGLAVLYLTLESSAEALTEG